MIWAAYLWSPELCKMQGQAIFRILMCSKFLFWVSSQEFQKDAPLSNKNKESASQRGGVGRVF